MQLATMNGHLPNQGWLGCRRPTKPVGIDPDEDLRRRQEDHLNQVRRRTRTRPSDCLHNRCISCVGTGIKKNGDRCIHFLSCPCGRCKPGM